MSPGCQGVKHERSKRETALRMTEGTAIGAVKEEWLLVATGC